MISPFEVYVVLQLDSINTALVISAFLLGAATVICLIVGAIQSFSEYSSERDHKIGAVFFRAAKRVGVAFAMIGALAVFTPSTKTMAAMLILPAITSNEVIQPVSKEAGELYDLAKAALKQLGEKEAASEADSNER